MGTTGRRSVSDSLNSTPTHSTSSIVVASRRSTSDAESWRSIISRNVSKKAGSPGGRKSVSDVEVNLDSVAAFIGVKVMAADMPEMMQVHAFRCARRAHDGLDKFSTRQIAHDIKKEFDRVYGLVWHCIVGSNFGSFVTHCTGCFVYFSMEKIMIMLYKTRDPRGVCQIST